MRRCRAALVSLFVGLLLWPMVAQAAVDRAKLLSDPGVFATFAAFSLKDGWAAEDVQARISYLKMLKSVIDQHRERVAIDVYLLQGLTERTDLLFRIHATDLRDSQSFLNDLRAGVFGRHLSERGLLQGMTKRAQYVPGFSEQMKADLAVPTEGGPRPYAIVIPIQKTAEWWALDEATRAGLMQAHTASTLPYTKTVARKLYHSTGLDDQDFITYFETARLDDFHALIRAHQQTKEFQYTRRMGHPIWLGRVVTIDELTEALAQ
ncbi:MAG: chlorite dismutase family protein [Nitrospiraceae bacterium]